MVRRKGVLRIHMRRDQLLEDVGDPEFTDPKVVVFAPNWVKQGLYQLRKYTPMGTIIKYFDKTGATDQGELWHPINLTDLEFMARNKASSRTGKIKFRLFNGLTRNKSVVYAFKDLVRQCVIIGTDMTTHCGGYGCPLRRQQSRVVVIDLIGLQFQRRYNTGRLVLIGSSVPKGMLDDLIFDTVVGEPKRTVKDVKHDKTGRYVKRGVVYFDTLAYERFVEQDFILVCLALHRMSDLNPTKLNLKFLKYSTGVFAGHYRDILDRHIIRGVCRGMRRLLDSGLNRIKSFEFPFYKRDKELMDICAKGRVKCYFTRNDALKNSRPGLMTATTNCANPHTITGNLMKHRSVDEAIAENLRSKANKWSSIINIKMKEKFIATNMRC